jgi:chromosome partitioning protein
VARVIAVFNQAGGVGKTTLVRDVGYALKLAGKKVLLVDADQQGTLTAFCGYEPSELQETLFNAIIQGKKPILLDAWGMSLIPSNIDLAAAEMLLIAELGREYKLKKVLEPFQYFDYILIDSPPSLGQLSINVLAASDDVLIPIQTEFKAMKGTQALFDTIDRVRLEINKRIGIAGVVPTMLNRSISQHLRMYETLKNQLGEQMKVFEPVRRGIAFAEAGEHGKPIQEYQPKFEGIEDIQKIAAELLNG